MKKLIPLLLALCLLFSLCACGKNESPKAEMNPPTLCDSLLKSTAFSVTLEELPSTKASVVYGVEKESLAQAMLYHGPGTSKEQIVILQATSDATAESMITVLKSLVAEWIEADRDYAPQEVPKLEKAVLRQSGCWVVLVVANDPDAAAKIVGEYF